MGTADKRAIEEVAYDDYKPGRHKGRRQGHYNQCPSPSAIDDGHKVDATAEVKYDAHDHNKVHHEKGDKKDHHGKDKGLTKKRSQQ